MKEILVIPKKKPLESPKSLEEFKELLDKPQLLYSLYIHSLAHEYSDFLRKTRIEEENNQRYQDQFLLEKIKSRAPSLTGTEFESYLNEELPIIVTEIVAVEFDKRMDSILENARRVAREEVQISFTKPLKEQENFADVLNDLRNYISKSSLPNPEIYFKEIGNQKIINVLIDDTENYVEQLNIFSDIVNNIYIKFHLDLEILLFEKGEIITPFYEMGFKKFDNMGVLK